jgi:Sulfotransferase domain
MKRPNFLYVGAAKSGSTWLYKALQRHKEVYVPDSKELFYFDKYFERGTKWYFKKFSGAPESSKAIGEITHDYMYHPEGAKRICQVLGNNVRLLIFLRNPVDKVISGYLYKLRNGFTKASFEEDIASRKNPLKRVHYDIYVHKFLKYFNNDQIGIFFFEDLVSDPNAMARDVFSFLRVDTLDDEDFTEKVLPASKSRLPILSNILKRAAILGRDLGLEYMVSKVKQNQAINKLLYIPYGIGEKPQISEAIRSEIVSKVRESVHRLEDLIRPDVKKRWPEYF